MQASSTSADVQSGQGIVWKPVHSWRTLSGFSGSALGEGDDGGCGDSYSGNADPLPPLPTPSAPRLSSQPPVAAASGDIVRKKGMHLQAWRIPWPSGVVHVPVLPHRGAAVAAGWSDTWCTRSDSDSLSTDIRDDTDDGVGTVGRALGSGVVDDEASNGTKVDPSVQSPPHCSIHCMRLEHEVERFNERRQFFVSFILGVIVLLFLVHYFC